MLTQRRLKKLCHYDPNTGIFTAIKRRGKILPGKPLGCPDKSGPNAGRINLMIDGQFCRAHRLAWLYIHGYWPEEIDHINGNPSDNRISNLRLATRAQQAHNTKRPITNKSGRKGVSWHKKGKKWQAHIRVNGINMHLGLFANLEEAHAAYRAAAYKHNGEYARVE